MKAVQVHMFGRDWCHQQFYSLVNRLASEGYGVSFKRGVKPVHESSVGLMPEPFLTCNLACLNHVTAGRGVTPWLALVDAINHQGGGDG